VIFHSVSIDLYYIYFVSVIIMLSCWWECWVEIPLMSH